MTGFFNSISRNQHLGAVPVTTHCHQCQWINNLPARHWFGVFLPKCRLAAVFVGIASHGWHCRPVVLGTDTHFINFLSHWTARKLASPTDQKTSTIFVFMLDKTDYACAAILRSGEIPVRDALFMNWYRATYVLYICHINLNQDKGYICMRGWGGGK